MSARCFRLNHTLTQYLVIFGSLVLFFCFYYFDGHRQLMESATAMINASENWTKHEPIIVVQQVDTTKTSPTATAASTTTASTTTTEDPSLSFKSTCSAAADRRGPHQNVIGYSMYGKNFSEPKFYNLYLKMFEDTLRTIPDKYPGWVVRIYHELKSDDVESWKVLNKVLGFESNSRRDHIDLCNATEVIRNRQLGDIFEMTWRWLPMLDDLVDTLMSRDSDSVIITREQDAVREWLASNKTFHIMRDNPHHSTFFVGCCWGVKLSQNRSAIVDTAEKMFHEKHLHHKGFDQDLLVRFYRSMAVESMVAHDSYWCQQFKGSQPFPTPRQNGMFIGWQLNPNAALKAPCPESCRPHNLTGPLAQADWSLC